MKKKLTVLSLMLCVLLAACSPANEANENAPAESNAAETTASANNDASKDVGSEDGYYPVTIETLDAEGNPVEETFEKAPERVVCVYQSPIETMLALGLEDRVVLAGQLDIDVKYEWKGAFDTLDYKEDAPSKEAVLAADPDLIISWSSYFGDKTLGDVKEWQDRGVNTYIFKNSGAVKVDSLENEYDDLMNIGKIFNKEDEAKAIVDGMKTRLSEAEEAQKGKEPVRATILEIEDVDLFRNYGADTVGGQIAEKAGAELAIDDDRFGAEKLLSEDPDVIFIVYFGDEKLEDGEVKKFTESPSLQSLQAIKNERVYPISLSEVYASGVRTADGIDTIIAGLYPEQ